MPNGGGGTIKQHLEALFAKTIVWLILVEPPLHRLDIDIGLKRTVVSPR